MGGGWLHYLGFYIANPNGAYFSTNQDGCYINPLPDHDAVHLSLVPFSL